MVIHEIYIFATRLKIVFFEEDPPKTAATYLKGYILDRFNSSDIEEPRQLANVAAVIFRQNSEKPNKIVSVLKQYAKTLLWHDCRVFVNPARVEPGSKNPLFREIIVRAITRERLPTSELQEDEVVSLSEPVENAQNLTPSIHILGHSDSWIEVVRYLQNFPPGPSPSLKLEIEAVDEKNAAIKVSSEQIILIQRAFHDCLKVKLVSNSDGISGIDTYRVYATLKNEYVRETPPYQHFVKLGERNLISKEYIAYCDNALEHIPFHLGPRLRLDRCSLGAEQGIIVSDYVSGSEKLRDCARDGRAVPVIANLFNTTLMSWRDGSMQSDTPLQEYLKSRMPDYIPEHRKPLIEKFGNCIVPTKLKAHFEARPSTPVRVGVVHGDLHSLNVLVRGADAIVIDFEKVENNKPLLLDLASLEAGLFVDGFIGDQRSGPNLLDSIECLYKVHILVEYHSFSCDPSDGSAWFFDCVKQIRMQARQIELENGQYALTLAAELAKKACKEKNFDRKFPTESEKQALTGEDVRALAYVLAGRILANYPIANADSNAE